MWTSRIAPCTGVYLWAEVSPIDNLLVPSMKIILGCTLGLVTIAEKVSTAHLRYLTLQEYYGANPPSSKLLTEIYLTCLGYRSVE